MISVKQTRIVQATPEDIFSALNDPTQLQHILPRVERVEVLEQHADRARLATYMGIGHGLGTIRCEGDLQWVEPTQISFIVRKPLTVENLWLLKPISEGTEIEVTMSLDLTPMLGPLANFVPTATISDMLKQDLDSMLAGIDRFAASSQLHERIAAA